VNKTPSRSALQKKRILDAAQTCFIDSGFHSASMARIAQTADMSPGLIYRYFDSKHAIICAIVESQLEITLARIQGLRDAEDLSAALFEYLDAHDSARQKPLSVSLFLEMSAAGMRDPEIAQEIKRLDQKVCAEIADWLGRSAERGGYGLPAEVAAERALGLQCVVEGLKVRKARDPSLKGEHLRKTIDALVSTLAARP
jgi:AcrR family transcriptional regulator